VIFIFSRLFSGISDYSCFGEVTASSPFFKKKLPSGYYFP
jgi:hypothetical protein